MKNIITIFGKEEEFVSNMEKIRFKEIIKTKIKYSNQSKRNRI